MEKKYQVFISSTFKDLEEERKEVIQALLELDCIPTGMELFQASDESQWDLIKRVIDDCDYYILIIAGRYGSIHPETKKSYTQMEYEYAQEKGIPIISFLHREPGSIPSIKTENNDIGKRSLDSFKELVSQKMVKYWLNPQELGGSVSRSMINLIKVRPAIGWIRANAMQTDQSIANELELLRKENIELKDRINEITSQKIDIADFISDLRDFYRKVGTNGLAEFLNEKYFQRITQIQKNELFQSLWRSTFFSY